MELPSIGPFAWLVLAVLLGIGEAISPALVCVWFCAGAAGAFVASMLGAQLLVQAIVFLAVSLLGMVALRPWFKHRVTPGAPGVTDVDALVGRTVTVVEPIQVGLDGRARLGDTTWFARCEDGSALDGGSLARVTAVDGTRLVVAPFGSSDTADKKGVAAGTAASAADEKSNTDR